MATSESANTFRILVASDIHLGYMENDPKRGNDSFVTFEEILSIAKEKDVDMILHGGDLFHENKPSRQTLHACLSLLREYCMGDKAIQFEYLSDQSADYQHCKFQSVNYEDPNLNISIPMFSIHGNHDDPTGPGNLCSLDLLHTAGLMNYFGKSPSLDKIQISPLLLQKGDSRLALYGLGSIRDERLHRVFVSQNITMLRPREHQDEWFNIFMLHQNRVRHSATSYIPEQFLEDFLDLVIWGHEHECRLNVTDMFVERTESKNFFICQPGSSIATSLSESETVSKYVGLLEINKKKFRMKPIRLNTVRQFYMQDIVLSSYINPDTKTDEAMRRIEAFCKEKVMEFIEKAREEHSGTRKQPTEPLIRLRVDYTGFTPFSAQRFGKQFVDEVANPKTIINFMRRRQQQDTKDKTNYNLLDSVQPMVLDSTRVEDMVNHHFNNAQGDARLEVLSEKGMGMAVKEYVEKEEKAAISELVRYQVGKTQTSLKRLNINENDIDDEIQRIKEERRQKTVEEDKEFKQALEQAHSLTESISNNNGLSDEDDMGESPGPPTRGRGRGRAARSRGGRQGRGRGGRAAAPAAVEVDDFDEPAKPARGGTGSRRGRRGAGSTSASQQSSIANMFPSTSRRTKASSKDFDDEDVVILDDSDDDVNITPAKPRQRANPRQSQRSSKRPKKEINFFDSDDDDDVEYVSEPPKKSTRRR